MNAKSLRIILASVATAAWTLSAHAALYDAAGDFSGTSNPNGVWSFGWSASLGGFTLDTVVQNLATGVPQWRGNTSDDGNPSVFKNTTGSALTIGTITLPAASLAFHPGANGEYSIVRFTAPAAGSYLVAATFTGRDSTSTDVHVLKNGVSIFANNVNGYLAAASLASGSYNLAQGETVDFAVGRGGNGTFNNDSTGLQATLTAVPEPTTMIAGALLLLPFGASTIRFLRRNRTA